MSERFVLDWEREFAITQRRRDLRMQRVGQLWLAVFPLYVLWQVCL